MRRILITLMTAGALLSILSAGCGAAKTNNISTTTPPPSTPAISTTSLGNTAWTLVSYGDPTNLKPVIAGSKITLSFNAASDQASGNGGVNGYGGDAHRTDNQLTLTRIIRTLMASTNQALNDQENTYFQLLQASQSIEFGNNSLTIHCQGGQELVFNAA